MIVSAEENFIKTKSIINSMSKSEVNLEDFCELIEKESSGKIAFSHFKKLLDKCYENIPKNDRLYLLKNIQLKINGLIPLFDIFEFFSETINKNILSPIFAFYKIANKVEKNLKTSTLEFIYNIGLTLDSEITINDFLIKVALNLRLEDVYAIMVFKGLDYRKKGNVRIEDFVLVIDSYRDDLLELPNNNENEDQTGIMVNNYISEEHIKNFYEILELNYIQIEDIFKNINEEKPNEAEYIDVYNYIKTELDDKISDTLLKNVLDLIRTTDNKILRNDLENLIEKIKIKKGLGQSQEKPEGKELEKKKREDLIHINEASMVWIHKFLTVLNEIVVSPVMVFSTANKDNEGRVYLDSLRKKLRLMIPQQKLDSLEINNIINALDINGDKVISQQDFNDVLNKVRKNFEKDSKVNNDNSVNYSISTPKIKVQIDVSKSFSNIWANGRKSINYHLLPIKGNYKVLANIKEDTIFNKESEQVKFPQISSPKESMINNNESVVLNNKSKDFNNPPELAKMTQKSGFFKEEKLEGTQASFSMNVGLHSQTLSPNKLKASKMFTFDDFNLVDINLIDILEGISIRSSEITSFEIFNLVLVNYQSTDFPKRHISDLVKAIDANKDGFISNLDLINFLLKYFKHRSTILGLKEINRKIQFEIKTTTEDFFTSKGLNCNDLQKEMSLTQFTEFITKYFNIDSPISKKMYEDYRILTPNKKVLILCEIFDLINEYREEDKKTKNLGFNVLNSTENNLLLNKKSFEEAITKFVKFLCDSGYGEKNNSQGLLENLKYAVTLPDQISLSTFKNNFIKPLKMDFSLGVAIFQLLKTFSHKNEQVMSKTDLFMFLESYTIGNISDNTKSNRSVDYIVSTLERSGCPIKFCLESVNYTEKGIY